METVLAIILIAINLWPLWAALIIFAIFMQIDTGRPGY
jgi:hypothetical protein